MPAVIRQALAERVRRLPEMIRFLADVEALAGIPVEFVGPLGLRAESDGERSPLCALLQRDREGCRYCAGTVQRVLERASASEAGVVCDAGMRETAIPLHGGGQTFGYFLFGRHFPAAPTPLQRNRIRHMLERLGCVVDEATLEELCAQTPVVDAARHAALVRVLQLGARHLVLVITENLVQSTGELSPLVQRACAYARRHFTGEIVMADLARELDVSVPHLCRAFHRDTGLRFREYVGRLRAHHARDRLLGSEEPITSIAFASGFQTLSQFNRVFLAIHGAAPRALRRDRPLGSGRPP